MDSETQESLFAELGLDHIEEAEESDTAEGTSEAEGEEAAQEEQPPTAELNVSKDNMTAYIRVKPAVPGQVITSEFILDFLVKNGIVYGICNDAIADFCENKKYYLELICAHGLEPVDEENGVLEYLIRKDNTIKPKEKEDGTVDFRDLGLVQNVAKGDVLCRIIPPEPGRDGINIYDAAAPHIVGKLPSLPSGTNTVISEDTLSLLAAVDGCVVCKKDIINVEDVFVLRGDVDNASGNIDFLGSVVIQGDIREGFYVKAGASISVRGMSEGAFIEAGGDISISSGMNGMGKGKLIAGGNVVAKYFENVTIECKGDVYADVLMNSRVTTEGSIILKGKQSLLIGGCYQVGLKVFANTIGNSNHIRTDVSIVSDKLNTALYGSGDSLEELQRKLSIAQKGSQKLEEQIVELTKNASSEERSPQDRFALKTAITKKSQFAALVELLQKNIKELEEAQHTFADFQIIGVKIIYPGTKINIANYYFNIENEYSNTKFYADTEHIVFAPILPSDSMDSY